MPSGLPPEMMAALGSMDGADADEMALLQQMMQKMGGGVPAGRGSVGRKPAAARRPAAKEGKHATPPNDVSIVGFQAPVGDSMFLGLLVR